MPLLDKDELNYATPVADETTPRTRQVVVSNDQDHAVLHIGLRADAAWLDFYPAEFALGPGQRQRVVTELHPERNRNQAMAVTRLSLFGQYIASGQNQTAPPPVAVDLRVVPPASDCPTCGTDLEEGATECKRCGERLRLCPKCGAPNTWRTHLCRLDRSHIIRPELDWLSSPGGGATHAQPTERAVGTHLARAWSVPSFPPANAVNALEWSAPVLAYGTVVASAIDPAREKSIIYSFEATGGTWLWEYDFGDPSGIYPDRGGLAIALNDGILYASTLNGTILAIDSVRGTLRWSAKVDGPVYGGPAVGDDRVVIPAGKTLHVFDRKTGALVRSIPCAGRLDTAPAIADGLLVAADDSGAVCAYKLADGSSAWSHPGTGSFDAAPVVAGGFVYAASTDGSLTALSLADGSVRWRSQVTPRAIGAAPALSTDGRLYVAADDGCLHVVAADTGNTIRTRRMSETPLRCGPVCTTSAVFVGANDGRIYAMTPDYVSDCVYETTPGARIIGAGLAIYGEYLAAAATNGVLYILRITT